MKLHQPERYYGSCALTALAMVTGWKFSTIRRKVVAARKKYPLNRDGFRCKKTEICNRFDWVFHNEFRPILLQKGIRIYWRELKRKTRLRRVPKFLRKGTYLIIVPDHVLILQDGLAWDNGGHEQYLDDFWQADQPVLCYARLP